MNKEIAVSSETSKRKMQKKRVDKALTKVEILAKGITTGIVVSAVTHIVIEGLSTVDESMVTGESLPVVKDVNQQVVGGCINGNGVLKMRVTAIGTETVLANIIRMVDQAQSSKLPIQKTNWNGNRCGN